MMLGCALETFRSDIKPEQNKTNFNAFFRSQFDIAIRCTFVFINPNPLTNQNKIKSKSTTLQE
jgi:hypothetical protein